MELKEAIRCLLDGNAILFAGSGFSQGAIKNDGTPLSTAEPLSHKLLDRCGFSKEEYVDDLGKASEIYKELEGEVGLVEFLHKEFTVCNITQEQHYLSVLPWMRIYTTNYDNVFTIAYQQERKKLNEVVLSDRINDIYDKSTLCIHLNGMVSRLDIDKLKDELKLTNSSYLTDSFRKSPWLRFFQTDLETAKAVFFVGYSMQYDLDIQRLVFSSESLKKKAFFILWEKESRANQILVQRFGDVLTIGVSGFTNSIREIQKSYMPQPTRLLPLLCFAEARIIKSIPSILDKDAFDLFFRGNYSDMSKVYYSLKSPEYVKFCFYRDKLDDVLRVIKKGERNILVHSSLGNGKTIFLTSLSSLLVQEGYSVYTFQKYRNTLNSEIERICQISGSCAVVFDRYADYISYLEIFKNFRNDQLLILAERTAVNDIRYERIANMFGEFYNVDLNKLNNNEATQFIEILDYYGFWSEKAGLRRDEKLEFIMHDCRGSIGRVILQLLHSEHILQQYKEIINGIRNKQQYYDAIIFILISQVAGFDVDTDVLINALDANQLNSPSFRQNYMVREFIDFNGNMVKPCSSIVANVLLEEIFQSDIIVDVMIRIYNQLNEQRSQHDIRRVLQKMMNYSNLQHILNKKDTSYKFNLIHFYEAIRPLASCAENPHFWLQYAILKLSEYDYTTANVYFNNAYAFAKRMPDFDTYQIDNHHARFLLENEITFGSQTTCMLAFQSAHEILMDPKHKEDAYFYPYRVSQKYYPFYEKYFKGMNKNEKNFFLISCESMLERTEWYLANHSIQEGRRDVLSAKDLLIKILREQKVL